MIWQDIVITICNVLFSYALIPTIYKSHKSKKPNVNTQTAILTTIGLFIVAIALFTLKLYLSTTITIITGILWLIMLIQSLIYR